MYRAVTLYLIQNQIALNDTDALEQALKSIDIQFSKEGEVILNGINVSQEIRDLQVSSKVSQVAAISAVRRHLVALQKTYGLQGGIVMDGRDIGTVVFPDADLKIFLTADKDIRIQRRYDEMQRRENPMSIDEVRKNLMHRDHIDSTREDSPLTQADDAILLDNSRLDREGQLQSVMKLVKKVLATSQTE
jgi:cytidylate kinase